MRPMPMPEGLTYRADPHFASDRPFPHKRCRVEIRQSAGGWCEVKCVTRVVFDTDENGPATVHALKNEDGVVFQDNNGQLVEIRYRADWVRFSPLEGPCGPHVATAG